MFLACQYGTSYIQVLGCYSLSCCYTPLRKAWIIHFSLTTLCVFLNVNQIFSQSSLLQAKQTQVTQSFFTLELLEAL